MTEDEYCDSVRFELYGEDGAPRLSEDETQRFLAIILSETEQGPVIDFSRLHRPQGNVTLKQRIDDHVFNTGSIDALIMALKQNEQRIAEAGQMLQEIKTAYLAQGDVPREGLLQMLEDYRKISACNVRIYQRALEKIWDIIVVPIGEKLLAFTDPVSPWVVAVASDAMKAKLPGLLERVLSRPKHQRVIYRVHRKLIGGN